MATQTLIEGKTMGNEWTIDDPKEDLGTVASRLGAEEQYGERMLAAVNRANAKITSKGTPRGVEQKTKGKLTPKQRLFVSLVVQGHSQSDAYRKAYSVRPDNQAVVSSQANALMKNPKVNALLESSLQRHESTLVSDDIAARRYVMTELLKHSREFKGESQRLKALELIGKASGMFSERVNIDVKTTTTEDLKKELASHLKLLEQMPTIDITPSPTVAQGEPIMGEVIPDHHPASVDALQPHGSSRGTSEPAVADGIANPYASNHPDSRHDGNDDDDRQTD